MCQVVPIDKLEQGVKTVIFWSFL